LASPMLPLDLHWDALSHSLFSCPRFLGYSRFLSTIDLQHSLEVTYLYKQLLSTFLILCHGEVWSIRCLSSAMLVMSQSLFFPFFLSLHVLQTIVASIPLASASVCNSESCSLYPWSFSWTPDF
jgi:hypothetical protein